MEPEGPPPAVIDYFYAGQGAEALCGHGLKIVVREIRGHDRWRSAGTAHGIRTFTSGRLSYSLTASRHPAHSAVWITLNDAGQSHVYAACGYGDASAFRVLMTGLGVADADVRRHTLEPKP